MFQKLYHHLEEISRNTKASHNTLTHTEDWLEKVSEQLEAVNFSVRMQKDNKPSRAPLFIGLCLASLVVLMTIFLAIHTFQISRATRLSLDKVAENARLSGYTFAGYRELRQQQEELGTRTARLDSIIEQQSQIIRELRRLNGVAVRALVDMKKEMEQRGEIIAYSRVRRR